MRNQRGEVIIGVMCVVMVVMMIFGAPHMMHGGHRSEGGYQQMEQNHNHNEDGTQHMHNHDGGQDPDSSQDEGK